MGTASLIAGQLDMLRQLGFQVEFRGNALILKYPRHLIEAEIMRQVMQVLPAHLMGKVRVQAQGDIVVEVALT